MYLCLRLCNNEFNGLNRKLLFGARFNLYSDELLSRWKWFHELDVSGMEKTQKLHAFFSPWFNQIPLVYSYDGQIGLSEYGENAAHSNFLRQWLKIMMESNWMSSTYCDAALASLRLEKKGAQWMTAGSFSWRARGQWICSIAACYWQIYPAQARFDQCTTDFNFQSITWRHLESLASAMEKKNVGSSSRAIHTRPSISNRME